MSTEKRSIYTGRDLLYRKELTRIEEAPIPQEDKNLIITWHEQLFSQRSKEVRVAKLSSQLRWIIAQLPNGLKRIDRAGIQKLVATINTTGEWSEATKADYKRCLKQFYSWYKDHDPRLEEGDKETVKLYQALEKVPITYKEKSFEYGDIVTEEDLDKLVTAAKTSKDKAFITVLHEAGFRITEMLNIRLKDVEFGQDRVIIRVDGKTGTRRVPLVRCMGYLSRWIEEHPRPDDRNEYLWLGEQHWEPALKKAVVNQPIRYTGAVKLIQRLFERAGLKKQNNLHWFRHSRATINAQWMTEMMLCQNFGWVPGSKQVRRYCHCNVSQLEDVVMEMNGLKKPENTRKELQKCACGLVNNHEARYCLRCGKPLSVAVVITDEALKKDAIDEAFGLLSQIMTDPEMKKRFAEFQTKNKAKT